MENSLSALIITALILLTVVGPLLLASCSQEGGHPVLMEAMGLVCSSAYFAHLLQHLERWQTVFVTVVVGAAFIWFITVAIRKIFLTQGMVTMNHRQYSPRPTVISSHMKFHDHLRKAIAHGIIGAKRLEALPF